MVIIYILLRVYFMQIPPSSGTFLLLTCWTEAFTFLATLLAFGSAPTCLKQENIARKRRQIKILKLKINCNKLEITKEI